MGNITGALFLGQEPLRSPVARTSQSLMISQIHSNYLKPTFTYRASSFESSFYWKRYFARETTDFKLQSGNLYEVNLWFEAKTQQRNFRWGIEGRMGVRRNNLNEEIYSAIFLNLIL
jgi:hypothetical protein